MLLNAMNTVRITSTSNASSVVRWLYGSAGARHISVNLVTKELEATWLSLAKAKEHVT